MQASKAGAKSGARHVRRALGRLVYTLILLAAAGCATFLPTPVPGPDPHFVAPPTRAEGSAPVALVLSGGSARGFAHVGVIKALEAHGLKPDIIVGASAGAVVGALYASGLTAAELEAAVARMSPSTFTD